MILCWYQKCYYFANHVDDHVWLENKMGVQMFFMLSLNLS